MSILLPFTSDPLALSFFVFSIGHAMSAGAQPNPMFPWPAPPPTPSPCAQASRGVPLRGLPPAQPPRPPDRQGRVDDGPQLPAPRRSAAGGGAGQRRGRRARLAQCNQGARVAYQSHGGAVGPPQMHAYIDCPVAGALTLLDEADMHMRARPPCTGIPCRRLPAEYRLAPRQPRPSGSCLQRHCAGQGLRPDPWRIPHRSWPLSSTRRHSRCCHSRSRGCAGREAGRQGRGRGARRGSCCPTAPRRSRGRGAAAGLRAGSRGRRWAVAGGAAGGGGKGGGRGHQRRGRWRRWPAAQGA
jgi:hypothetical protein